MRLIFLRCGSPNIVLPSGETIDLPALPSRRDLAPLDGPLRAALPHDLTPSLDEIAASPNVSHLGKPALAPQQPEDPLRLVVVGDDAALSAILTRLMRIDALWVQLAYIPTAPSAAAENWGLDSQKVELALRGAVNPVPLIRDDSGTAVAGSATITAFDADTFTGEIIIDDHPLAAGTQEHGVRLVPMLDAPGIAAVRLKRKLFRVGVDKQSLATGRALQAGGRGLKVTVDGVARPRAVDKVTFYRHLRDVQIVR